MLSALYYDRYQSTISIKSYDYTTRHVTIAVPFYDHSTLGTILSRSDVSKMFTKITFRRSFPNYHFSFISFNDPIVPASENIWNKMGMNLMNDNLGHYLGSLRSMADLRSIRSLQVRREKEKKVKKEKKYRKKIWKESFIYLSIFLCIRKWRNLSLESNNESRCIRVT